MHRTPDPAVDEAEPTDPATAESEPFLPSPTDPAATGADPMRQPPLFSQIEDMKAKDARDELFDEAVNVVIEAGRGSVSLLQRKLRIGYSRSSRLVDQLEEAGVLGADQGGNQGRAVLIEHDEQPSPSGPPPRIIGGTDDDEPPSTARPRVWM